VKRFGEHLLARSGFALDDDRYIRFRESSAHRVQAPHREARSEQPTESLCTGRRLAVGVRQQLDTQDGRSETHELLTLKLGIRDLHAVHPGPVRRRQVADADARGHELEREVASRDLRVIEPYGASRALSDEDLARSRAVERESQAGIGALHHTEDEDSFCRMKLVAAILDHRRDGLCVDLCVDGLRRGHRAPG
jgi:hypothetical protein